VSYILAHWTASWPVLGIVAAVVAVHAVGLRLLWRAGLAAAGRRDLARQAAAFYGGVATVLLALVSPVAHWALIFIWVRSVQDLLLAVVAPGLIVLGAPGRPLAQALRRRRAPARPGGAGDRPPAAARAPWWLAWPAAVTVVFNVVWLGWHLTGPYDLATANPALRYAQWVTYTGAGIWLWLQLIGSGGSSPAAAPMRRLALVVGTAVADTILGMALVFGSGVVYPAYRGAAHHVLSVVADQQVGGAVLWMGMLPPLIVVTLALFLGWLEREESDELSRDLDRLVSRAPGARPAWAGSRRPAWSARSGYRRPTI